MKRGRGAWAAQMIVMRALGRQSWRARKLAPRAFAALLASSCGDDEPPSCDDVCPGTGPMVCTAAGVCVCPGTGQECTADRVDAGAGDHEPKAPSSRP